MLDPATILIACVGGAIVGSFVGTVVVRMPKGRSALEGRSHCDRCGGQLRAWELVPVFSYLISRGLCGRCRSPINVDHLLAEIGCIVACLMAAVASADLPGMLCLSGFGCTLAALAILDARHFWLPDRLTLPLMVAGLACTVVLPEITLLDRVIGVFVGYAGLEAVRIAYARIRGREGLGRGDAKLMAAIGAWLGWNSLPCVLILAGIAGIAVVIGRRVTGRPINALSRIPLGTLLAASAAALQISL